MGREHTQILNGYVSILPKYHGTFSLKSKLSYKVPLTCQASVHTQMGYLVA